MMLLEHLVALAKRLWKLKNTVDRHIDNRYIHTTLSRIAYP